MTIVTVRFARNDGTLENKDGQVTCTSCKPNTYYTDDKCVPCEAGYTSGIGFTTCFSEYIYVISCPRIWQFQKFSSTKNLSIPAVITQ